MATFLFAIPLIPSLLMTPLALAGIPPALNVLQNFMSAIPNGKPMNTIISALSDPLSQIASTLSDGQSEEVEGTAASSASTSTGSTIVPKPSSSLGQMDSLRNIAKMFRSVLSRRNFMLKPLTASSSSSSSSTENIISELLETTGTTSSSTENKVPDVLETIDELLPHSIIANHTNAKLGLNNNNNNETSSIGDNPINDLNKSIRAMDTIVTSIRDVYSVIRNGLRRYEITDTDCQSRIVCEIHQKVVARNKMLKTFSLNAIDLLR